MWREQIKILTASAVFKTPADEIALNDVENVLKVELPVELRKLLSETNGVDGEYSLGLVWDCERIKVDNLKFRNKLDFKDLYMPFDSLLFFGDAGNGDQFAFAVLNGKIRSADIYVWSHENDSRAWVAPSLEKYFEWWLSGQIKI